MNGAGPLALLRRMFQSRIDRDGQAPALEGRAALLDVPVRTDVAAPRRLARVFGGAVETVEDSLALKVMDGWLQNQHQILVPLTVRFAQFSTDDMRVLMQFVSAVMLNAGSGAPHADDVAATWLRHHGAGPEVLHELREALHAPLPLNAVIGAVLERDVAPYAYAAAVALADTRTPTGHLFANYIAARLDLPADAVRSIDRRYRR